MYCMLVIVNLVLKDKPMDKAESQYVCRARNMRTINASTPYLLTLLDGADFSSLSRGPKFRSFFVSDAPFSKYDSFKFL